MWPSSSQWDGWKCHVLIKNIWCHSWPAAPFLSPPISWYADEIIESPAAILDHDNQARRCQVRMMNWKELVFLSAEELQSQPHSANFYPSITWEKNSFYFVKTYFGLHYFLHPSLVLMKSTSKRAVISWESNILKEPYSHLHKIVNCGQKKKKKKCSGDWLCKLHFALKMVLRWS